MTRIQPLPRRELARYEAAFTAVESAMGFVPSSMYSMARVPGFLDAFLALSQAALGNDLIPRGLKQMVAFVTSAAAGCRYCQAHTGAHAEHLGIAPEKLAAMWEFETSDHFDDAERAALRLAFHAGVVPNAATDEDFVELRRHYDDDQIAAIMAVVGMFGLLNRWNDTLATTLEDIPISFGERMLSSRGWDVGKHAG